MIDPGETTAQPFVQRVQGRLDDNILIALSRLKGAMELPARSLYFPKPALRWGTSETYRPKT